MAKTSTFDKIAKKWNKLVNSIPIFLTFCTKRLGQIEYIRLLTRKKIKSNMRPRTYGMSLSISVQEKF